MRPSKKVVELSSYKNNQFNPGTWYRRALWYIVNEFFFRSGIPWPSSIKSSLLRFFGANILGPLVIKPRINIKYPWFLTIEKDVWLGEGVWIDNLAHIEIQSNVCVSQGAMLLCGNHNYKKSSFDLITKPIILEEGCWVGAKAVVCPGVIVHSHAVLGVGAVATRDLKAYGIYQGNPAIWVRERAINDELSTINFTELQKEDFH